MNFCHIGILGINRYQSLCGQIKSHMLGGGLSPFSVSFLENFAQQVGIEMPNNDPEYTELAKQIATGPFSEIFLFEMVDNKNMQLTEFMLKYYSAEQINQASHNGLPLLEHAVQHTYYGVIKLLIDAGADVNKHSSQSSPLISSITRGDYGIIKLLIEKGANLNQKDGNNRTPLMVAEALGRAPIVQLLVDSGAKESESVKPFVVSDQQTSLIGPTTPLVKLSQKSINLLYNLNRNFGGSKTDNPYIMAKNLATGGKKIFFLQRLIDKQNEELAELVIEHYNPEEINKQMPSNPERDYYLFDLAIRRQNVVIVKLLIKAGADINRFNGEKLSDVTPLMRAIYEDNKEIIELLIRAGADINHKDSFVSPLTFALREGKSEIAKFLINIGVDVNKINSGSSPLEEASRRKNSELVQLLIQKGADVNQGDSSPLVTAIGSESTEIVKLLIQAGANVNQKDRYAYYQTPLLVGIDSGELEIVKLLIQAGADVNQKGGIENTTPLKLATKTGKLEMVKLLIDAGANVLNQPILSEKSIDLLKIFAHKARITLSNRDPDYIELITQLAKGRNKIPFLAAIIESQNEELFKLFIEHYSSAEINELLSFVITWGTKEMFRLLIKGGADINQKLLNNFTPLIIAIAFKKPDMVQLLIDAGADVSSEYAFPDKSLTTPLLFAIIGGNLEIIRLLIDAGADVRNQRMNLFQAVKGKPNETEIVKLLTSSLNSHANQQVEELLEEIEFLEPSRSCRGTYEDHNEFLIKLIKDFGIISDQCSIYPYEIVLRFDVDSKVVTKRPENSEHMLDHVKKCGEQIIICYFAFVPINSRIGHANLVAIDKKNLQIERFEPNGDFRPEFDQMIKEHIVKPFFSEYKYVEPLEFCPQTGPQNYDTNCPEGGFCSVWTTLYGHARLRFQTVPKDLIIKSLIKFAVRPNFIQKYLRYIEMVTFGDSRFMIAVISNNIRQVKKMIQENADLVNQSNGRLNTPLMNSPNVDMTRLLIENGAEVDKPNLDGRTALMTTHNFEIVRLLVEKGADVNHQSLSGSTPIFDPKNVSTLQLLIDHGAQINHQNNEGKTALMSFKTPEVIKLLIQNGADINHQDNEGKTALIHYIRDKQIVELLIDHGADINHQDNEGKTALIHYIRDKQIVQLLIDNGADINHQDNEGKTALMQSAYRGYKDSVEILLAHGAKIDLQDETGQTALIFAIYSRDLPIIQMLLQNKADIDQADYDGDTPLMIALKGWYDSDVAIAKFLIESGADKNKTNHAGKTALMIAKERKNTEMINLFL